MTDLIRALILQSNRTITMIRDSTHTIIETDSIKHAGNLIEDLVSSGKRVLLILDVDEVLVRPAINVRTDPWFTKCLVRGDDLSDTQQKLYLSYAMLHFTGVEHDTDDFVKMISTLSTSNNLSYMCLTSRHAMCHSYTTQHLKDANYHNVFIRPNMLKLTDPLSITNVMSTSFNTPCVRYVDNICSCTAENKGVVTDSILTRCNDTFDVVVFIDDSLSNINKVHDKLKMRMCNESSLCVHYTYMKSYSDEDFARD